MWHAVYSNSLSFKESLTDSVLPLLDEYDKSLRSEALTERERTVIHDRLAVA